jgi:hypothetical protein
MSAAIVAQLEATFGTNTPPPPTASYQQLADAIANAVVAQITSSAVVNSTGIGNLGAPVISMGTIS